MLHGSKQRCHQQGMIFFSSDFDFHCEVWAAPHRCIWKVFSLLERYTSHKVRNLSKGSDTTDWKTVFIKVKDALIWVGNLAEKEWKQMFMSELVYRLQLIKQSVWYIKVILRPEVSIDDSIVCARESFVPEVLLDFFRVYIFRFWS